MLYKKPLMFLKPNGEVSGASSQKGGTASKKYDKPVEYKSTTKYDINSIKLVPDENGGYKDRQGNRASLVGVPVENAAFREIKKLPLGSIVMFRIPRQEFRIAGVVPAHNEYYEVRQRTRTIKVLKAIRTTDKRGYYTHRNKVYTDKDFSVDINSTKEIQSFFRTSDRITIKRKK